MHWLLEPVVPLSTCKHLTLTLLYPRKAADVISIEFFISTYW